MTDDSNGIKDPVSGVSDQKRAFLEYKKRVGESGKPFFPYGVWHDVIAATAVIAFIICLSTVWFSQANCDSLWNPSCDRVSTPLEQEQYTPSKPGELKMDKSGKVDKDVARPILGLLYEEKADPATTSYHPRPEWYFYFLFYLLVIFSNPQLVVLATILIPTIWLMMLLAWPFLDRKKERRPSRRPVAMAAMVLTAITLLSFSYLGSQEGVEQGGPEGISDAQAALPGYDVLFGGGGIYETCQSCHQLGGVGNGGPGPNLDAVGTRYDTADELTDVLANGLGGGQMPVKGGSSMTDEQAAQVAAFLATLGNPDAIANAATYGLKDWERVTGSGSGDTDAATEDSDGSQTDPNNAKDEADPADVPGSDASAMSAGNLG